MTQMDRWELELAAELAKRGKEWAAKVKAAAK